MTYDNNSEIQAMADYYQFERKLIPMKNAHHEQKIELVIGKDLAWLQI